ncbi:LOW QUALITY PROTEIN: FMRFamide receptor-like [Panulirus ornatus]|uniref:LOW QUALITY PROTEIN: FMRFamide receptor-like n=1 Tax=Panulirus ornatus TaxID=150431 RepID=UPI003A88C12E
MAGVTESVAVTPWPAQVFSSWDYNMSWDNTSWDNRSWEGGGWDNRSVEWTSELYAIDHIQFWVTPVLVMFGCVGNVVSVWVFHSTKLRTLSSSCYLAALAASDTGFLVTLLLVWLSMIGHDLLNQPGWCQAINYAIYVTTFLSVWLVVAFTVERFIAVCYPLLRATVCTVRRARLVILLLTAVALLLYSYLLVAAAPGHHPGAGRTMCKVRPQYMRLATTMNHIDTLLTLVLPVLTVVTLNVRIARCVWHVERLRHSMTLAHCNASASSDVNRGWAGSMGSQEGGSSGSGVVVVAGGRGSQTPRVRSQNKVTKMLLIISTVFILLNLPSYGMRAYIFFWCGEKCDASGLFYTLQQTFTLLFYTNFAINFLLYCVTGQNFRRAVAGMCLAGRCCPCRRRHHYPGSGRGRRHRQRQGSINLPGSTTRPSPGSIRFPPPSTFDRNATGSVMVNIQLWEGPGRPNSCLSRAAKLHHNQARPPRPHALATPISNGHTRITNVPDEKEDSF